MASARYTLNITADAPEEKHIATRKEKWVNFWFYYKWHVILSIAAIVLVGLFVRDLTLQVDPDYQIGILSEKTLSSDALLALEAQLSLLANDRNGDGTTNVSVMEYTIALGEETAEETSMMDPYTHMAGVTKLMADGQMGSSMLFLTSNPVAYHEKFSLFSYNDGTSVPANAPEISQLGVAWKDCPVLTALPLGEISNLDGSTGVSVQSILSDFYLLKRATEGTSIAEDAKAMAYYNDAVVLFDALTAKETP